MKKSNLLALLIVAAIIAYFLFSPARGGYAKLRSYLGGKKATVGTATKGNDSGGVLTAAVS
jgi:hypothetical protein